MRIAFLTPEYVREGHPHGGLANYLSKICPLLQGSGHDPVVFLLGKENATTEVKGVPLREVKRPRFPWRLLPRRTRAWGEFFDQRLGSRALHKAFARENAHSPFDIVQAASSGGIGDAFVGKVGPPVVVRLSTLSVLWRAAQGKKLRFAEHLTDWLFVNAIQRADGVFAPSQLLAGYAERLLNVPASVVRSPFFVPLEAEDSSVVDRELAGKSYLLFFGKLNRLKGADVLAEALPEIFAAFPDVHVAFAGTDKGRFSNGLTYGEYACKRAGKWSNHVHLLGNLPRAKLLPVIRGATLVVLPSRIDNYPNTCLEAQSLGKIVVGTRNSSLDEMVTEGETGFLAESGNPSLLAQATARGLSLSAEQIAGFTDRIRSHVAARSNDKVIGNLTDFYRGVLDASGGRPV